jgi:polyisoprenyl-phosphate glycosyltransferase
VSKEKDFSVVVPVYNSAGSLKELYTRLSNVFKTLNSTWELVLVNDCSKDNSMEVIKGLVNSNTNVIGINLMNNFGQHNATICGLKFSNGKLIITMDDDLQHPPEEIPKLIDLIKKRELSVVYAQFKKREYAGFRNLFSNLINKLIGKIINMDYSITQFKIMQKNVVEKLVDFKQYHVMIDVLIRDIVDKSQISFCLVEHHKRKFGESNYSLKKLVSYALNMIFNFTTLPLKIAIWVGFFFSFVSFIIGVFLVLYYLIQGVSVSGWTSLIISLMFFSGLILFVLGVIGEYLGKIFLNINHKPQYVIKEEIRAEDK